MTQLTEDDLFTISSNYPSSSLPGDYLDNDLVKRLLRIFYIIDSMNELIGTSFFEVNHEQVFLLYNIIFPDDMISDRTGWRYLAKSKDSGLITKIKKIVCEYHEIEINTPKAKEIPSIIIKDKEDNIIPLSSIKNLNARFFIDNGGQYTIRIYKLSEKAKLLLNFLKDKIKEEMRMIDNGIQKLAK